SFSVAAGGVNNAVAIQTRAAQQVLRMEQEGNRIRFDGQTEAAAITRDAGFSAAQLRYYQHLSETLGRSAARGIEKSIEMRY
ncbi:MAG TPA: hypothetical protein VJ302_04795, partial [Blastocatellia bacterium]|nr:hypothetical protein [Blastocatellia bacterium]